MQPPEAGLTQGVPPQLSIIIPTLNEAAHLPALLADLQQQQGLSLELIVGDGGSIDATARIAASFGARFVHSGRGRGRQMNAAARWARGEFMLFLHADSRLEDPMLLHSALTALQQAARAQPRAAGHFGLHFHRSGGKNALAYRYIEEKTALNRPNTTNGDQGMLLARAFFIELGGFDDSLPFLEDQRLAEKIRRQGRWITLPGVLHTSARRFESEGWHRRYLLMGMMMGFYSIGELRFFSRAPAVYRVQEATGRLQLAPIFGLLWSMVRHDWGLAGTLRTFYRLGRYIRHNTWQLFFFLDVWLRPLLGPGRSPLLSLHDRIVAPCINFRVVDGLVGLGCFVWYMGILASWFSLLECIEQRRKNGGLRA